MRGGVLPPALLFAALALALAFAPRRAVLSIVVAAIGALVVSRLAIPVRWQEAVFLGCWASIALAAAAVHLPRGIGPHLAPLLGLNTGLWAGAVVAVSGAPRDLTMALPLLLSAWPLRWLVARGGGLAIKVVSSWLIAVAILAAALSAVPTPGYVPDHME